MSRKHKRYYQVTGAENKPLKCYYPNYAPEDEITELKLVPPFTGFVIDRLRLLLYQSEPQYQTYLDNILTRIESVIGAPTQSYTTIHGFSDFQRPIIVIPICHTEEIIAIHHAFTVPEEAAIADMCKAIRSQLTSV